MIHSRHVANVSRIRSVSDRMLVVDLTYDSCSVRCISVYLPHSKLNHNLYVDLIESLSWLRSEATRRKMKVIIGGDFNTQLMIMFVVTF